jgi:hypothetical protein
LTSPLAAQDESRFAGLATEYEFAKVRQSTPDFDRMIDGWLVIVMPTAMSHRGAGNALCGPANTQQ